MTSSRYIATMRRENLRTFFESSPTSKLLRSDNAPLVIDFLNRTFKTGDAISLGLSDLKIRLAAYQEELHAVEPELLPGAPDRYLTQWSDAGWLLRFLEASSTEPQFQLTRYSEEAIRFVDSVMARSNSLVGTESRLRLVIETLEDIVRGASADPNRRLEYLRAQRELIDQEIQAIESGKSVVVYRPSQIRERFQTAVDLLKALQSDFRAVEERFQSIARDVQQRQATGQDTRGGILGFALDSEDLLKQQDEGISFFAFVAFLFSPTQQASLRKNIEEIQQLTALVDQQESLARVRRMVPALLAEADKVMKTTARLSATLRKLLDAESAAHRLRLSMVLRDLKQLYMKMRDREKPPGVSLSISSVAELQSPLSRTFWTASESFTLATPVEHVMDISQVQQIAGAFAKLHRLDFRKLRGVIREGTYRGQSETLGQLTLRHPLKSGVVELLGYLQIAHDDHHRIDPLQTEVIRIHVDENRSSRSLLVKVPLVTFLPKSSTSETGRKPR